MTEQDKKLAKQLTEAFLISQRFTVGHIVKQTIKNVRKNDAKFSTKNTEVCNG